VEPFDPISIRHERRKRATDRLVEPSRALASSDDDDAPKARIATPRSALLASNDHRWPHGIASGRAPPAEPPRRVVIRAGDRARPSGEQTIDAPGHAVLLEKQDRHAFPASGDDSRHRRVA